MLGVMTYDNGSRYEGDWANSEKSGKGWLPALNLGTQTYGDRESYTGDWRGSMKEGQGKDRVTLFRSLQLFKR